MSQSNLDFDATMVLQEGVELANSGKNKLARQKLELALDLDGENPQIFYNLGVVLCRLGLETKASKCFQRAVDLDPEYQLALVELAKLKLGKGDKDEAERLINQGLRKSPHDAQLLNSLGNLHLIQGRLDSAKSIYLKALRIDSSLSEAWGNLAQIEERQGVLNSALKQYKIAYYMNPDLPLALENRVVVAKHHCDWGALSELLPELEKKRNDLLDRKTAPIERPMLHIAICGDPEVNFRFLETVSNQIEGLVERKYTPEETKPYKDRTKIRLGYVSSDFRDHPVAHIVGPVLKNHDKDKFEVVAFATKVDGSGHQRQIEKDVDIFVDVSKQSQRKIAATIKRHKIDILIDLNGYTKGMRLEVFAARPAPVQVTGIGFPSTTGAKFFDYVLVDKVVAPKKHRKFFSETCAYLPNVYVTYDKLMKVATEQLTRAEYGLEDGVFVMACFGKSYKLDEDTLMLWFELLEAIPRSQLWILDSSDEVLFNIFELAKRSGCDASRIVVAPKEAKAKHLNRLQLADVVLDTSVYNGHVTTSDALFVGVPVVALLGTHFASRVAASLLVASALGGLVAKTRSEYFQIVKKLAENKNFSLEIKAILKDIQSESALFDNKRYTRDLEGLYLKMWDLYQKKRKPEFISLA